MRAILLTVLLLGGCATTKVMDGIMTSWVGSSLDEVIAQWGYPDEERQIAGRTLYIWRHSKTGVLPATTTGTISGNRYTATTYGGGVIYGECDRILEVRDQRVVSWEWKGNNCPFAEAMEYSRWRKR